jgi:hypothetical protein
VRCRSNKHVTPEMSRGGLVSFRRSRYSAIQDFSNRRARDERTDVPNSVMSRDGSKIRELYASGWKVWFSDEGDPRHRSLTISEWC